MDLALQIKNSQVFSKVLGRESACLVSIQYSSATYRRPRLIAISIDQRLSDTVPRHGLGSTGSFLSAAASRPRWIASC